MLITIWSWSDSSICNNTLNVLNLNQCNKETLRSRWDTDLPKIFVYFLKIQLQNLLVFLVRIVDVLKSFHLSEVSATVLQNYFKNLLFRHIIFCTLIVIIVHLHRMSCRLRLTKQKVFWVTFDHFWSESYFWRLLGNSQN